jgi:DNA polymerase-3 subunit gamma/tau
MYNSLTGKAFELISEYSFELAFENQSQADDFNAEMLNHLQGLLRRDLNNTQITLQTKVSVEIAQNFIYTAEDKFRNMASKNPALVKLKQRLGLDFE